jgi:hypothetical protein
MKDALTTTMADLPSAAVRDVKSHAPPTLAHAPCGVFGLPRATNEGATLVDPVTLVVTAVALGASAGLTETATTAIKDAYGGLKRLLTTRQVDLSAIERKPDSKAQQNALEETLTDLPGGVDRELLDAAQHVAEAVSVYRPEAAEPLGVDLRNVQAEFIRVRSIDSSGTGFRGEGLTLRGGVDLGDVRAGRPHGGADPSAR